MADVLEVLDGSDPSDSLEPSDPDDWSDESAGESRVQQGVGQLRSVVRRVAQSAPDDEVSLLDADLRRARRPALLTVPDEIRSGRRGVSSAALVSLLALVVAVGCAFLVRVLWAERSAAAAQTATGAAPTVQVVGGTAAAARVPTAAAGAAGATASQSAASAGDPRGVAGAPGAPVGSGATVVGGGEGPVVVHVVGQVNRPGVVQLRQGARVADAITAAGGTLRGADLSALNLARLVQDGEQIRVPRPGEAPVAAAGVPAGGGTGSGGASGPGGTAGAPGSSALVSLNSADVAALDTLPGVGPVLAQRIVDWRTEHGRFTSIDELGEVSGIGDKMLAQLRPKVTL
ncbi:ComEA family DNA-binding protein [Terrabacter sp. NPDC080008]|uniref:ComEA family DNA-binding protein n=1 Tax=Terrabacter sp. NPDC080008 TaxID=3155176 RepID=UPI00344B40A9